MFTLEVKLKSLTLDSPTDSDIPTSYNSEIALNS